MTDKAITLVEALRTACSDYDDCDECPAYKWCHDKSEPTLCEAAADLIESLAAELEQVKRERDAAVEDLSASRACRTCDHCGGADFISRYCSNCVSHSKWRWRGPKEA